MRAAQVRPSHTRPVRAALAAASAALPFGELVTVLSGDFPAASPQRVGAMLAALLTGLRAPMTVPDALGHVRSQPGCIALGDMVEETERETRGRSAGPGPSPQPPSRNSCCHAAAKQCGSIAIYKTRDGRRVRGQAVGPGQDYFPSPLSVFVSFPSTGFTYLLDVADVELADFSGWVHSVVARRPEGLVPRTAALATRPGSDHRELARESAQASCELDPADQAGHDELCAWATDAMATIAMYAARPGKAVAGPGCNRPGPVE